MIKTYEHAVEESATGLRLVLQSQSGGQAIRLVGTVAVVPKDIVLQAFSGNGLQQTREGKL